MEDKQSGQRPFYATYEECGIGYGQAQPTRLRPEMPVFVDWVPNGARVIDLGCGDGALGQRLIQERHCHVSGVEIDEAGVAQAKKRGVDARAGNLDDGLPFPDNSFDVATINVTLHMVFRPGFVIEEALRLAPRVIVSFPNFGFWVYRLELLLRGRFPKHALYGYQWYDTRHIHMFSLADLQDYCRTRGLRIVRVSSIGLRNRRISQFAKLRPNFLGRTSIVMLERPSA